MNCAPTRRGLLLAALGLAANQALPSLAFAAPGLPTWFKFGPKVADNWDFAAEGPDGDAVSGNPVGFGARPSLNVLVTYARPSTAYDAAVSRVLEVTDEKQMRVGFRFVNYGGDLERLKGFVKAAEADRFDAILAMGSDSVAHLLQAYRDGALPVVTVCAKDPVTLGQMPDYEHGSGNNFAFTSLNMPIDVQMGYLFKVRPALMNLAILADSTNVSAVETQCKPVAEYLNRRDIRAMPLYVSGAQAAKAELPGLLTRAIGAMQRNDPTLANSAFWITGSTSVFQEIRLINQYSGRAPVLSVVPEVVAAGDDSAALSVGVSFESNAHLAAIYLAEILRRRNAPGAMKVGVVSPPDIAINFRRAKAAGLRIPFDIFEQATTIYDYDGKIAREDGLAVLGR